MTASWDSLLYNWRRNIYVVNTKFKAMKVGGVMAKYLTLNLFFLFLFLKLRISIWKGCVSVKWKNEFTNHSHELCMVTNDALLKITDSSTCLRNSCLWNCELIHQTYLQQITPVFSSQDSTRGRADNLSVTWSNAGGKQKSNMLLLRVRRSLKHKPYLEYNLIPD